MKENYCKAFTKEIAILRKPHSCNINPKKAALLVIDMQDFFIKKSSHAYVPSVLNIIPRLCKLQNYCFENNILVIHTKHCNNSKNSQMMSKWWGDDRLLKASNKLAKISDFISDERALLVSKTQYDSFYNSKLESLLVEKSIKQIIITGVMTHLCCETTARSAFVMGYEVFFGADTTATYNKKFHLNTLMNLAHGFAVPLLIDEIIDCLK